MLNSVILWSSIFFVVIDITSRYYHHLLSDYTSALVHYRPRVDPMILYSYIVANEVIPDIDNSKDILSYIYITLLFITYIHSMFRNRKDCLLLVSVLEERSIKRIKERYKRKARKDDPNPVELSPC